MIKRILTVILSVLTVWLSSRALTIGEARQLAMERYPLMQDYRLIELTREFTVENAAKAWLPQVGVGVQSTWQSDVATYPDALTQMLEQKGLNVKGMSHLQWKAQVEVTQSIWDGGRIKASQEVAKHESEEARLANDVELYQLRQRIDDIYFGILLLELQKESIGATIALLRGNVEKVKSLVRNGAAMQCDADAIEAELLTVQQQLTSVHCASDSYRSILELYIGEHAKEELQTPEPIHVSLENNSSNRPESQLLSARQSTIQARLSQLDASVRPRLSAFATGYYGYPGMNFMEAMMNHRPSFNAMIGLSLSWNIGSLYTKGNNRRLLQASAHRVEVARNTFDFNIGVQATKERNELHRLLEISESDADILSLRKRVRQASEARLREGIVEPLDLLKSITEEKNASIAADTHRIEYIRATYQMQYLLNY